MGLVSLRGLSREVGARSGSERQGNDMLSTVMSTVHWTHLRSGLIGRRCHRLVPRQESDLSLGETAWISDLIR